jgi:hypothetical protein
MGSTVDLPNGTSSTPWLPATLPRVRQTFERFQTEYGIVEQDVTEDRTSQLEEVRRYQTAMTRMVEDLRQAMLAARAPCEEGHERAIAFASAPRSGGQTVSARRQHRI